MNYFKLNDIAYLAFFKVSILLKCNRSAQIACIAWRIFTK